jgi:predicted RNase H-like nuclease (RuvC/YqgF family)
MPLISDLETAAPQESYEKESRLNSDLATSSLQSTINLQLTQIASLESTLGEYRFQIEDLESQLEQMKDRIGSGGDESMIGEADRIGSGAVTRNENQMLKEGLKELLEKGERLQDG